MPAADVDAADAEVWAAAVEEHELLSLDDADHDQERFLAGVTTPVMFASALQNFGVAQLLDLLLDLAPAPGTIAGVDGTQRRTDDDFSAFVFKVQSGMNNAHRDRLAYARVVSGTFERGMVVNHAATGKPFATKFAQSVFGREEWLRPYTVQHVADLAQQGIGDIAVISPAFASDCIETLEEINGEIREAYEHAGGTGFTYIPCLNDDPAHIEVMMTVIRENGGG